VALNCFTTIRNAVIEISAKINFTQVVMNRMQEKLKKEKNQIIAF
jgi:chromosome condensin MukBEF complex kleisin-like MukF subunit